MSKFFKLAALCLLIALTSVRSFAQSPASKYKCMIQMTNYMGEGAYIVISVIDPKGNYDKTLYVLGQNKRWYNGLKEWNNYISKKPANLSAITGASVTGGDRAVNVIEIPADRINAGYKLRFETAVEDQAYHVKDLEMPLTTDALSTKNDGTGFIRYVRFSAN